jgi:uncharacterized membrane protein
LIRGERAEIGDAFGGFTSELGQLALGGIVPGVFVGLGVLVVAVPLVLPVLLQFFQLLGSGGMADPTQFSKIISNMGVMAIIGIILAMIIGTLLNLLWMFTLPLIIDKKLGFWDAMEVSRKAVMKNILHFIGLVILMFLVGVVGFLACIVGVCVAIPINFAIISYAYEDIFTSPIPKAA